MVFKGKKDPGRNKPVRERKVEFRFHAPEAMEVYVAGEFNQWNPCSLAMKKDKKGDWRAEITLLPGRYEYKLIADDNWVEDVSGDVSIAGSSVRNHSGPESAPNPFGTQNFVIWI